MELLLFRDAARLVKAYNDTQNLRDAAATIGRPYAQCREILDWLWEFDFKRDPTAAPGARLLLPPLTKGRWANYLYAHNVAPQVAAVLLGWTVHEVLHSCGGPVQWRQTKDRKRVVMVRRPSESFDSTAIDEDDDEDAPSDFPRPGEPTLEEIEQRAAEVRAEWTPTQRANAINPGQRGRIVEVMLWTDTRR